MKESNRRDEIARAAARLLRDGKAENIADALGLAMRGQPAIDAIPHGLVREHVRGFAMEALGDVGYREHVVAILAQAEEIMTLLEMLSAGLGSEARTALIGRAARGQVDADPCCRIRVETDEPAGIIAALLVDAGYEEPTFATTETRHGRLTRLDFNDGLVAFRLTRCPPSMRIAFDTDLVTGKPVPSLDLAGVRRLVRMQSPP